MKKYQFKTNINCDSCISAVKPFLDAKEGIDQWNVDITRADKILTVQTKDLSVEEVEATVKEAGYKAEKINES